MRDKDLYYLTNAFGIASGSKDPSTKVGAIIVNDDGIISTGFNGLPRNFSKDHDPKYWQRPKKYEYVVHAEMNAIINAARTNGKTIGATLYVTEFPCHRCAPHIINAGIIRIVTPIISGDYVKRWKESIEMAQEMFYDCKVKLAYRNI